MRNSPTFQKIILNNTNNIQHDKVLNCGLTVYFTMSLTNIGNSIEL